MDVDVVRSALRGAGLSLAGGGLVTGRPISAGFDTARHRALEAHYTRFGRAGRIMLHGSASVQVCVDAGDSSSGWRGISRRWWLANSLGPVLTAMFANSPSRRWRSTRQFLRLVSDPVRARPMADLDEPHRQWAAHVLDSPILAVSGFDLPFDRDLPTLRQALDTRMASAITDTDLRRHVTSVMAPVRARGYLELRMIDAQPEPDGWIVPLAVVASLLDDPAASDGISDILRRRPPPIHRDHWLAAARDGLAQADLAEVARECIDLARAALQRGGVGRFAELVAAFAERYTYRARCPADDPRQ
jgi:glutamate--cysteine ligase